MPRHSDDDVTQFSAWAKCRTDFTCTCQGMVTTMKRMGSLVQWKNEDTACSVSIKPVNLSCSLVFLVSPTFRTAQQGRWKNEWSHEHKCHRLFVFSSELLHRAKSMHPYQLAQLPVLLSYFVTISRLLKATKVRLWLLKANRLSNHMWHCTFTALTLFIFSRQWCITKWTQTHLSPPLPVFQFSVPFACIKLSTSIWGFVLCVTLFVSAS